MSKPANYYRTYTLTHDANRGKTVRITAVLPEYQQACARMQAWQTQRFYNGETISNRINPKHVDTVLSERYKRSILNQVCAGLNSWVTLTQDAFREIVTNSNLPVDVKRDLYRVNIRKAWYHKTIELPTIVVDPVTGVETRGKETTRVPTSTLKLARRIVKHVKQYRNRLPDLSQSRVMWLDGPVAQFEPAKNPSGCYDYWVRISTLTPRAPVWVPLKTYRYAEEADGEWCALTQVTVNLDGSVKIGQVKKAPLAQPLPQTDESSVGVDFGLTTLFATNLGDLYGQALYPWLKRIDLELSLLTANLQRQGIKLSSSKRYKRFQHRIKTYVTNEVNRVLNRLVTTYKPSTIVVESLGFRGRGKLSKTTRRLLSRFGRAAIKTKLESIHEKLGVTIVYVPAYYSSQECSKCGYVDKTNRKGSQFACGFCGWVCHADVNAARVIRSRRSWTVQQRLFGKTQVLQHVNTLFTKRWGFPPPDSGGVLSVAATSSVTPNSRRASILSPLNDLGRLEGCSVELFCRGLE